MANTVKKLYHAQPGTTITTAYTVPANTRTIVKNLILTNTTATDAVISVHFTATSATANIASNAIIYNYPVKAGDTVVIDLSAVLEASNSIRAIQTTASAITLFISGVEVS